LPIPAGRQQFKNGEGKRGVVAVSNKAYARFQASNIAVLFYSFPGREVESIGIKKRMHLFKVFLEVFSGANEHIEKSQCSIMSFLIYLTYQQLSATVAAAGRMWPALFVYPLGGTKASLLIKNCC
jgi:hypothetical protein